MAFKGTKPTQTSRIKVSRIIKEGALCTLDKPKFRWIKEGEDPDDPNLELSAQASSSGLRLLTNPIRYFIPGFFISASLVGLTKLHKFQRPVGALQEPLM